MVGSWGLEPQTSTVSFVLRHHCFHADTSLLSRAIRLVRRAPILTSCFVCIDSSAPGNLAYSAGNLSLSLFRCWWSSGPALRLSLGPRCHLRADCRGREPPP